MKIILDKKHTLCSDSMNIWIEKKVTRKRKRSGEAYEDVDVVTGYHQDLNALMDSFERKKVKLDAETTKKFEELKEITENASKVRTVFEREISKRVTSIKE